MSNGILSIRSCRANANMTQQEFADAIGVSKATVINWEQGKTFPRLNEVKKISDLSGVPLQLIFLPEQSQKMG